MLRLGLIDKNGERVETEYPTSFVINREAGAADDLTLYLPSRLDKPYCGVELENDGVREFTGIIDEQSYACTAMGESTMIYARSLAGVLLDNEAQPCDYKNADAQLIAMKYCAPLGIDTLDLSGGACADLQVYKGCSHWQVITSFCTAASIAQPYVDECGCLHIGDEGEGLEELYFSNSDGIEYTSAEINLRRCKLISSVREKAQGQTEYNIEYTDALAESLGVERRRYVDTEAVGKGYAEGLIDKGKNDAALLRIKSPRFLHCPLNSPVRLELHGGEIISGSCTRVRLSLGSRGWETTLTVSGDIEQTVKLIGGTLCG